MNVIPLLKISKSPVRKDKEFMLDIRKKLANWVPVLGIETVVGLGQDIIPPAGKECRVFCAAKRCEGVNSGRRRAAVER